MARIQIRRGSSSQWTNEEPTLLLAELGYETDTNRLKAGDGVTPWSRVPYFAHKDVVIEDVKNTILLDGYDVTDVGRLVYDRESKEVFVYDGGDWVSVSTGEIPTPTFLQVCSEDYFTNTPVAARDFLVNRSTSSGARRGMVETEDLKLRSTLNPNDGVFYGVTLQSPELMRIKDNYELILP